MPENEAPHHKYLGRIVSVSIIAAALITGLMVIHETNVSPRTDDAEVFANFIGIAPQVDGPITQLAVKDNAFVKQGGLLFEIDPRPYEYALQRARSDLNTLEGQIVDQRRTRRILPVLPRTSTARHRRSTKQRRMSRMRGRSSIVLRRNWHIKPTISTASSRCWRSNSSPSIRWIRLGQQ
jgi:multidrug resistance efflux pump